MLISSARYPYERPELACSLRVQRRRWTKETCGSATATGTWAKCACWVSTPNRRSLRVTAYVTHASCASHRYLHHSASSKSPIRSSVHCLHSLSFLKIYYDDNLKCFNFLLHFGSFSQANSADKDDQSSNPEISISIEDCAEQTGPDIKLDR